MLNQDTHKIKSTLNTEDTPIISKSISYSMAPGIHGSKSEVGHNFCGMQVKLSRAIGKALFFADSVGWLGLQVNQLSQQK